MDTYFASPQRSNDEELKWEIEAIEHNAVVDGLLNSVSSLLAVLNENRQIVALNEEFLKMLGIDDPAQTLGLRPGEVLKCVHANDTANGCGTGKYCSTCGAAIAIVSSLSQDKVVERICALETELDGKKMNLSLNVRSQPIKVKDKKFLLLLIRDITMQEKRAALERTFFHDINNILMGFAGDIRVLDKSGESPDLVHKMKLASQRLMQEVSMQNYLMQSGNSEYQLIYNEISVREIVEELERFFKNHPCRDSKKFNIDIEDDSVTIKTDVSALLRVLSNMLINAFEAVSHEGEVSLGISLQTDKLCFCVHNKTYIPEEIQQRIFQRNFTTKEGNGRGCGTYSMKLFGQDILGGEVGFTSDAQKGTSFYFLIKT